jgi:hypothetical protein
MGYRIKVKQIEGDIGGNPLYQSQVDDAVSSTAIGGAPSQTAQVWKTYTLSEVFDALLFPYQSPTMSLTVSGDSSLEVGQSLVNPITLTWNSTNDANVQGSSVTVSDVTGGITILSGGGSDGSTTYTYGTAVVKNSPGSHTWRAQGTNTNSQTYQGSATKNWYWRKYWGTSTTAEPTEALIEGLSGSSLGSSNGGSYSMAAGGYKYFAFPTSNGVPSSFTVSGFNLALADSADGFSLGGGSVTYKQITITNSYSQATTYNVFRSKNQLASAITVVIS